MGAEALRRDVRVSFEARVVEQDRVVMGQLLADFRDLVRYVMASPYLTNVTVNGTAVQAPTTGIIALPKEKSEVTVSARLPPRALVAVNVADGSLGDVAVTTLDPGTAPSVQLPTVAKPPELVTALHP